MKKPASYDALARLGRVQLSRHFFMRNFLNSEIGNFYGMPNLPDDPDLAIRTGRALCETLLEPLVETFGPIEVRSAYRSPEVNAFGNAQGHQCARNAATAGNHIWDMADGDGRIGACASIVIPWFAHRYAEGRDWRDLAWWLHDHLNYSEIGFFPKLAAFNLTWSDRPKRTIMSYIAPKGVLLKEGATPAEPDSVRQARYADFPEFQGIRYPE